MNLEVEAYEGELRKLRKALAQPEQEPVAWVYNGILHEFDPSEFATSEVKPLYTAPPKRDLTCVCGAVWDGEQMVHAPPKREWVGLTEDEKQFFKAMGFSGIDIVEAKLKERNT